VLYLCFKIAPIEKHISLTIRYLVSFVIPHTIPVAVQHFEFVGFCCRAHGQAYFLCVFVIIFGILYRIGNNLSETFRVGDVPGIVHRMVVSVDFDGECFTVSYRLWFDRGGIGSDLNGSIVFVAIRKPDEVDVDIFLVVEILDHVVHSGTQRCNFPGFFGPFLHVGNRDHVAVFSNVSRHAFGADVPNVIISVQRGLFQLQSDERIGVLFVIRNPIEDELLRGCSVDRVDGFGLVGIPPQLITFGGIVTHSKIIFDKARSHITRTISILYQLISFHLATMVEVQIVTNFVHLCADTAAMGAVIERELLVLITHGCPVGLSWWITEHDKIDPRIVDIAELFLGSRKYFRPQFIVDNVQIGLDVDDPVIDVFVRRSLSCKRFNVDGSIGAGIHL